MSSCFLTELDVVLEDEELGTWRLLSDLHYFSGKLGRRVVVTTGFVTDFASIPRLPVVYMLYANRFRKAAVIHDFLYKEKSLSRRVCDGVFREAIVASGGGYFTSLAMWLGVRIAGACFYYNYE